MNSIQELIRQKEALEKQIQEAQKAVRSEAITKVKELMAEHGLTVADLTGKGSLLTAAAPKAETKKVAAKFRNPVTGESWTGRGLKPKWLTHALAEGKSLEEFALPAATEGESEAA